MSQNQLLDYFHTLLERLSWSAVKLDLYGLKFFYTYYGDFGVRETELVRKAGYIFGAATISGPVKIADDLMRVRRITMSPNTSNTRFWKKPAAITCVIAG